MIKVDNLESVIQGCLKRDEKSQRELFGLMHAFTMSIATRYGQNSMETEEIANNALLKMLEKIAQYKIGTDFKAWLRKIVINSGIDYYRKYHKRKLRNIDIRPEIIRNSASDQLETEYLLQMIRRLSPKYKMVFNLYVMEG